MAYIKAKEMRTAKQLLWNLEQHYRKMAKQSRTRSARKAFSEQNASSAYGGMAGAYDCVANELQILRLGNRLRAKKAKLIEGENDATGNSRRGIQALLEGEF